MIPHSITIAIPHSITFLHCDRNSTINRNRVIDRDPTIDRDINPTANRRSRSYNWSWSQSHDRAMILWPIAIGIPPLLIAQFDCLQFPIWPPTSPKILSYIPDRSGRRLIATSSPPCCPRWTNLSPIAPSPLLPNKLAYVYISFFIFIFIFIFYY